MIRGVLFDSGDTLVRPVGGHWFPGPRFHAVLAAHGIEDVEGPRLDQALERGMQYLDAHHYVPTEADERRQFHRYYTLVLETLGVDDVESLARELVNAPPNTLYIEPFPDTFPVIERLFQQGFLLGVVSNAWPSLDTQYRMIGLRRFFGPFVISAQLGCCKPDPRIYEAAIDASGLPPDELLFVDDCVQYVQRAAELGMRAVIMARNGAPTSHGIPWARNLLEAEAFIDRANQHKPI